MSETVAEMRAEVITTMVALRVPEKAFAEQWQLPELQDDVQRVLNLNLPVAEWGREEGIDETHLRERIADAAETFMAAKAANMGPELMRFIEKSLLLQVLDAVWKEHLYALDHLRQGIGLRAYGQRDPLNEYKSRSLRPVQCHAGRVEGTRHDDADAGRTGAGATAAMSAARRCRWWRAIPEPVLGAGHGARAGDGSGRRRCGHNGQAPVPVAAQTMRASAVDPNDPSTWRNAGRNALCPCGSGRKYKHCHGRLGV